MALVVTTGVLVDHAVGLTFLLASCLPCGAIVLCLSSCCRQDDKECVLWRLRSILSGISNSVTSWACGKHTPGLKRVVMCVASHSSSPTHSGVSKHLPFHPSVASLLLHVGQDRGRFILRDRHCKQRYVATCHMHRRSHLKRPQALLLATWYKGWMGLTA